MGNNVENLKSFLRLVASGHDVNLEAVKAVEWVAEGELDQRAQYAYVELQQFCFDDDIRSKDIEYDTRKRRHLSWCLSQIESAERGL